MTVLLNPYLNFRGTTKEAMEFYKSVFGGDLDAQTFKDFGAAHTPADESLIMHSQLTAPGFTLMAADVPSDMTYKEGENNFSVSLSGANADDATLRGYFDKLSAGGTVTQPLEVAPWGDAFGMLVDKFGVSWLVNIAGPES